MNRSDYMSGKATHEEYYRALAEVIGVPGLRQIVGYIATPEVLAQRLASDEHLNNIYLQKWDNCHPSVLGMVRHNGKDAIDVSIVGMVDNGEKNRYGRQDPYTTGIGVVQAKLRGKHQRNRDWLLTSDDGKKFTLGTWGSAEHMICRRLSLSETIEYIHLAMAAKDAKEQLDTWIEVRAADLSAFK